MISLLLLGFSAEVNRAEDFRIQARDIREGLLFQPSVAIGGHARRDTYQIDISRFHMNTPEPT